MYSRNLQSRLPCSRKKYPSPVKSSSLTCQNTPNFQSPITGLIHWIRRHLSLVGWKMQSFLLEKRIRLLPYLMTTESCHLKTSPLLARTTARSNGMISKKRERECLSLLEVSEKPESKGRRLKISCIWLWKPDLCSFSLPTHAMKSGMNNALCPILLAIRVEMRLAQVFCYSQCIDGDMRRQ